jgi:peptidoglycan L-alanyl-D-glutamate endopeptidase CwlK
MDQRQNGLNLLYYPFRIRLLRGHEAAINQGIPIRIFETYRSRKRQNDLFAQGRTAQGRIITNANAGDSMHQYGLAADLVMWIDGKWNWSATEHYKKLVLIMESVGLRGGYKWGDYPHWELSDAPSIAELKKLYNNGGMENVWFELDKKFG